MVFPRGWECGASGLSVMLPAEFAARVAAPANSTPASIPQRTACLAAARTPGCLQFSAADMVGRRWDEPPCGESSKVWPARGNRTLLAPSFLVQLHA